MHSVRASLASVPGVFPHTHACHLRYWEARTAFRNFRRGFSPAFLQAYDLHLGLAFTVLMSSPPGGKRDSCD